MSGSAEMAGLSDTSPMALERAKMPLTRWTPSQFLTVPPT
eukprot:CAMPEP_0194061488 /NCGR_PEP_ID=MMETSP0009_2-20130614/74801_1 /TAXON_ID=210454 /ORGANISM="Grammatophora oceanica, Strain CCMP 410" /LENGTH=39 /DNA_ID=CAMNT_0038712823 /DNA_START=216 /DNA_END=331 /DNA_ORIENTATION=+